MERGRCVVLCLWAAFVFGMMLWVIIALGVLR